MAKKEALFAELEKAYEEARAKESEELHNALVGVIHEYKPDATSTLSAIVIQLEPPSEEYSSLTVSTSLDSQVIS